MANVYVLFWFDVEDCTVTQSDDAAKRLAQILTANGVRGTMKIVGQKARMLRERVRYDVIDALSLHAIGYHANWHGLRPQVAEYLAPLDWEDGIEEFEEREGPGIDDVVALFHRRPYCYGQPGGNWAPHVYPVLRKWDIHAYVSGFNYMGVNSQPFWYGGVLNASKLYGKRDDGTSTRHALGLNFELGKPGELDKHKRLLEAAYEPLKESGGFIHIMNHPCTLVLEQWFSTYMKPRELTEAGYKHFEDFIHYVLAHENMKVVAGEELLDLYPDRAQGRVFGKDELAELARSVGEEVKFLKLDSMTLSAAELFGMFVRFIVRSARESGIPPGEVCTHLDGPAKRLLEEESGFAVSWDKFVESAFDVGKFLARERRVPNEIWVDGKRVTPGDYFISAAAVVALLESGSAPEEVTIMKSVNAVEKYADESAARSAWGGSMSPRGFQGPNLLELGRLQAWTIKPAVLSPR